MADAFVRLKAGEKRPVYGQTTAASGTLTVGGSPTCTLFDVAGAVVGTAAQAVTGFENTALAAPRVWINLDTAAWTGAGILAAGYYDLVFSFTATGSDTIVRNYKVTVALQILPVP